MTRFKNSLKTIKLSAISTPTLVATFLSLAGLFYSVVESAENPSEHNEFAEIDSGFFVSKKDVYGLQDEGFKEKLLLFITEKGIMTKSSKGLIYYYISEDAVAQIEDLEFRGRVSLFLAEPEERRVYIVKPGDSLWDIAEKYRISVEFLAHLNSMTPTDPIYPGQRLRVSPDRD